MKKNKKLGIGVISLSLALLLFAVLLMIQKSMMEEPAMERVLCAKAKIPEHVVITEENISLYVQAQEIPVMWLPEGYISDMEQLYGQISETEVAKGSILNSASFELYNVYYEDYRELSWISVPIKELYEGVAGCLRPGDLIDIYLLREEDKQYVCEILEERVPIAASYSSQGTSIEAGNEDGLCQLIVIPIEKEYAAQFYEKLAQGNIRIAKYEAG